MKRFTLPLPDGAMEVRAFTPAGVVRGGAVVYMDAFGFRPELDAMAARYATAGWFTLMPDLYRRLERRVFPIPADAASPSDPEMDLANDGTTLAMTVADTAVLLDDAATRFGLTQFGAVGYCMGARHALAAAAAFPDRVLAAALLHGGRMVNEGSDSPHRLIARSRGALYIGMARDDVTCPEPHQVILEHEAAKVGKRVEIERINALHGWTFPTRYCHDRAAADRAFRKVLDLFEAVLDPGSGLRT